ncbi:hypothetical protein PanWU01x14_325130 [Parasponia andersonii]|uniref:Uncharacterized protein n=1 Tax=Parasponia andersonii TaxID=3476 RepID=A0A2P5AK04_PARAD|nr:hypothetical protein PanWU01x14_325130 [Parasponia andersonii]
MNDTFLVRGRSRRKTHEFTNLHHFRVEVFYSIIDMQFLELNDRFNKVNTDLLLCMICLCLRDIFSAFDKKKLIHFAEYYPKDFSTIELIELDVQLETCIIDMYSIEKFN